MKGVIRFGKKRKLSPRYNCRGEYKLVFPLGLSYVHHMFHISMVNKYH